MRYVEPGELKFVMINDWRYLALKVDEKRENGIVSCVGAVLKLIGV